MFSVTTGEQTRVLQAHEAAVVGMAINPHNPLQLYSIGRDQNIFLWDYNDAIVLRKFTVPLAVEHFAFAPNRPNVIYLAGFGSRVKRGAKQAAYNVYEYLLSSVDGSTDNEGAAAAPNGKSHASSDLTLLIQTKARLRSNFLATPDGRYLIVQSKRHWKAYHIASGKTKKFKQPGNVSCIAIHPKQQFVAVGDDSGEITFWYIFGNSQNTDDSKARNGKRSSKNKSELDANSAASMIRDDPVTTTVHWHAHPVGAISFDSTGAHMLSGGLEMVLVFWQLESGKKDWLPRLNAPIHGISHSPDESLIALRCSDNTIKLINSRSRLLQVCVEGINLASPHLNLSVLYSGNLHSMYQSVRRYQRVQQLKTGLVIEPRTNAFAFSATEGQVQLYSAQEDRNILKVQVGPRNPTHQVQKSNVKETQVSQVAFSGNGDWMVTVDLRNDSLAQSSLKFWYLDKSSQQYEVNTQLDLHPSERIRAIAYHPKRDVCVSVSSDGKFKSWVLRQHTNEELDESGQENSWNPQENAKAQKGKNNAPNQKRVQVLEGNDKYYWTIASSGAYRNLEPRAACFSADGSLLAIAYNHIITLWSSESNVLLQILTHPPEHEPLHKLYFLNNSHNLVASSKRRIFVWDLLTCRLRWSHVVQVDLLTVDPKSPKFAVFSPATLEEWAEIASENHTTAPSGNVTPLESDSESVEGDNAGEKNGHDNGEKTPASSKKNETKAKLNAAVKLRVDGYVMLFSPDSHIPEGYWVLPAKGICALAFLSSRMSSRGSPVSPSISEGKELSESTLIYLNGDHEFKYLLPVEDSRVSHTPLPGQLSTAGSPSKAKKPQPNTLQLQQQFIAKINATQLAEGPSVFKLMYGGFDAPDAVARDNAASVPSNISLPKIATASKKAALPKGASAHLSPQARQATQQTELFLQGIFQADVQVVPAPATLFPQFSDALILKTTGKDDTGNKDPTSAITASGEVDLQSSASKLKHGDLKYIPPKKFLAAKISHAEVGIETRLLEAELHKMGLQSGSNAGSKNSDLSFLNDFFTELVQSPASTLPKSVTPTLTSLPAPTASSSTPSKLSSKNKASSMEVDEDRATPSHVGSSKKRKRSNSSAADQGTD